MAEKKDNNLRFTIMIIVIIIAVFGFLILQKSPPSTIPVNNENSAGNSVAPAIAVKQVTSVSATTLNSIGLGTANAFPKKINAPAITNNNKPEVFYEGAEYCPYCATERWSMIVALSQFGTFSNLKATHSSSSDVYPNTQTFSFFNSSYTSKYISFVPIEIYTNIPNGNGGYTVLQTPTNSQNNLVSKYDAAPYVPASEAASIPFIDFGGKYLTVGATYSPTVLQGKTISQIAASLSNTSSPIAKGVNGAANAMIAAICSLTNNQPTNVCNGFIQAIEKSL